MLMQWHITDKCNLRCSHCYQESYTTPEPSFERLTHVVEQFIRLSTKQETKPDKHACFWPFGKTLNHNQITVTGGEPFACADIFRLLEHLAARKEQFRFAVLTNGTLIDRSVARHLRKVSPAFVQVSIEGSELTHDQIRGRGSHAKAVDGLKCLVQERIPTMISFTAHRGNYHEFPEVARLGQSLNVCSVWADRLIPFGTGETMRNQILRPDETIDFFKIMHKAKQDLRTGRKSGQHTEIQMNRALQFLVAGSRPYHCSAGRTLVTVMPNGDLLPCRRMPIRVGNVFETPLIDLYENTHLFQELRDNHRLINACSACSYKRLCGGGLKCLAYALNSDPFSGDPGCLYAHPVSIMK